MKIFLDKGEAATGQWRAMAGGASTHEPRTSPIEPRGFFASVKIRPIVIGAVIDSVATYAAVMSYLVFFHMKEGGLSQEALERAWEEIIKSHEALLTLALIGAACTAVGGYVAARLAAIEEEKHGGLVGAVSIAIGLLHAFVAGTEGSLPEAYQFVAYLLAIPAGILGGRLAARRRPERIHLPR